jgi:hypothetical protein
MMRRAIATVTKLVVPKPETEANGPNVPSVNAGSLGGDVNHDTIGPVVVVALRTH